MLNLTPTTHLITSIRSQYNIPLTKLLGELIDNSIDAMATKIVIARDGKDTLRISDNGVGCQDLSLMLSPGNRKGRGKKTLGRYGIGAKDALINLGDIVEVRSVSGDGKLRSVNVDWVELTNSGSWIVNSDFERPCQDETKTDIVIKKLVKHSFDKRCVMDYISRTYYPAIRSNLVSVEIQTGGKSEKVTPPDPISLDHEQRFSDAACDIRGGIITDLEQRKHEGARIILEGKRVVTERVREYVGIPIEAKNVFFEITLKGDTWKVSKNKDSVDQSDLSRIAEIIKARFSKLINKAIDHTSVIELEELNNSIKDVFSNLSGRGKAKRKQKKTKKGTVVEVGTDKKHKNARLVQDGDTFDISLERPRKISGVSVRFNELAECDPLFDVNESVVTINKANPGFSILVGRGGKLDQKLITLLTVSIFLGYKQIRDPDSVFLIPDLRAEPAGKFLQVTDRAIQSLASRGLQEVDE